MAERIYRRAATFPGGLILITTLGTILRALLSPWKIYHPDSGLYLLLARRIAHGSLAVPMGLERGYYQPLFSAVTALFGTVFGNLEIAGCAVSIISGGATIALTGILAKRLFGNIAGLTAALLVTVHPHLVHFSGLALTESLYTALLIAAVTVSMSALEKGGAKRWVSSGALMGLAYLTRVAGFFEAFVPAAWILAKIRPRSSTLKALAIFVIGALVFMAPYIGYLRVEQDTWRLTGQQGLAYYNVLYRSERDTMDGKVDPNTGRIVAQQAADKIGTLDLIFKSGGYLLAHAIGNMKDVYRDLGEVFSPLFAAMIGLGMAMALSGARDDAHKIIYLFSWWIPAIALQALTGTSPRYYAPLAPLGAVVAGRGFDLIFEKGGRKVGIIAAVIVAGGLLAMVHFAPDPDANWVKLQREAGDWITLNARGQNVRVMTREPYIAYFANAEQVPTPNEPLSKIIEYARRLNIDYIVVDSMLVENLLPQFKPLLDPTNAPPGWKPAWTGSEEGRVIIVYRREGNDAGFGGYSPLQ